ncbi:DUF896 domain-containing protein [Phascolarctobacterium sp.]|uniref:DUF896 domain-containing protein n=1 Tax=Phascolarctobacterium sp. TaxID=2049039 RepID=UPI003867C801
MTKEMTFEEKIQRINALAHKKKTEGLTAEEQAEQKELYKWYLGNIRQSLKAQLDNIEVVEETTTTTILH